MKECLTDRDLQLVEEARKAISRSYDPVGFDHTVGAAVLCTDGEIYTGINLYSVHGACGEFIALGAAMTHGQRSFETIVAVEGAEGERVLPPCGNCRQMLCHYAPGCRVILSGEEGLFKVPVEELLPYAYEVQP